MNGNRRLTLLSVLVMLVGLLVISFMVKDRIIDKDKKSMQSGMTEDKDTENKDDVMENPGKAARAARATAIERK